MFIQMSETMLQIMKESEEINSDVKKMVRAIYKSVTNDSNDKVFLMRGESIDSYVENVVKVQFSVVNMIMKTFNFTTENFAFDGNDIVIYRRDHEGVTKSKNVSYNDYEEYFKNIQNMQNNSETTEDFIESRDELTRNTFGKFIDCNPMESGSIIWKFKIATHDDEYIHFLIYCNSIYREELLNNIKMILK